MIGPLGNFTCVVGPNGCGKSVVGEAIAFALGGNRKMLRANSLAVLLNQEVKAAGGKTAQEQLQTELALFNIHTNAVDRYIVTQSRQAVDVGSAVGLVKHLELLTGMEGYEGNIQQQGQLVEQMAKEIDQKQQSINRLNHERQQLAPHIAHWQKVDEAAGAALQASKQLQHFTVQERQLTNQHQLLLQQLESSKCKEEVCSKQGKLLQAQAEQQDLQLRSPCSPQHPISTYDEAVQQLHSLSDSGHLPGTFYGRLCSVAAVKDPEAAVAVNAALQEVSNLHSMMIVSDRPTANAVIGHFRQHRVGTVQCKILSEMQGIKQAAACSSVSNNASNKPLLSCVDVGDESTRGLPELLQQLLGTWFLVEDREVARQQQHLKRNMVTR
eukprot:gene9969-10123_t